MHAEPRSSTYSSSDSRDITITFLARPGRPRRARRAALRLVGRRAHARRVPPIRAARDASASSRASPTSACRRFSSASARANCSTSCARPGARSWASTGTSISTKDADASAVVRSRAISIPARASAASTLAVEAAREVLDEPGRDAGPYLQSRPRRAARSTDPSVPRGGRAGRARRGKGGRCVTIGVLVMAYGTPTTPRRRRGLLHQNSTRPPTDARTARRPRRVATTPSAARRRSPNARPTRWRALARALEHVAPGDFDVRFGSKYEPPLLEDDGRVVPRRGFDARHRPRPRPALVLDVDRPVHVAGHSGLGRRRPFIEIGAWWAFPGFLEIIAPGERCVATVSRTNVATRPRLSSRPTRLPEKILESGDDLSRSTARERASGRPRSRASIAGTSRGSRPVAPPTRGSVPTSCRSCARSGRSGVTDSCRVRLASSAITSKYSSTSTSRRRASRSEVGLNSGSHRVAQRRRGVHDVVGRRSCWTPSPRESRVGRRRRWWHQRTECRVGTLRRRSRARTTPRRASN